MEQPTKKCECCEEVKPHSYFYKRNIEPDGLDPFCRVCRRWVNNQDPSEERHEKRKAARDYYASNRKRLKKKRDDRLSKMTKKQKREYRARIREQQQECHERQRRAEEERVAERIAAERARVREEERRRLKTGAFTVSELRVIAFSKLPVETVAKQLQRPLEDVQDRIKVVERWRKQGVLNRRLGM